MEDLRDALVSHELAEGAQVIDGDGVDERYLVAGAELHQAQARPVGALADEFGVDGDDVT
jgi:hypothetical protein